MKIKICGITEVEHALVVQRAGADFIGLVFAQSTRRVSAERAQQIVQALAGLERRPAVAGVFVNSPVKEVNRVAAFFGLDWVQLSGDETWHYCKQIKRPVIKAVHVPTDMKAKDVIDDIAEGYRTMEPKRFMCLLDAKAGEAYGGTGKTFNWQLAKEVSEKYPVIVAGGLDPDNVKKLISDVHPWGVDVSSGVESDGKKDPEKITAFINAVRETEPMSGNDRLLEGTIE